MDLEARALCAPSWRPRSWPSMIFKIERLALSAKFGQTAKIRCKAGSSGALFCPSTVPDSVPRVSRIRVFASICRWVRFPSSPFSCLARTCAHSHRQAKPLFQSLPVKSLSVQEKGAFLSGWRWLDRCQRMALFGAQSHWQKPPPRFIRPFIKIDDPKFGQIILALGVNTR